MPVRKRSYSLDERAATYLDQRAKKLKRSASSVLSELVVDAARQDARDRLLEELTAGAPISERDVQRWLKKLGAV
jgi:hypothetical protein